MGDFIPKAIYVKRGYRGHNYEGSARNESGIPKTSTTPEIPKRPRGDDPNYADLKGAPSTFDKLGQDKNTLHVSSATHLEAPLPSLLVAL